MLVGSILLATSVLFLFNPGSINTSQAFWWFLSWLAAVFLFWTIAAAVPYESLGPVLCRDYHERTRLFALRDGLLISGTIMAAATPILIRNILSTLERPTDDQTVFFIMSLIYAFLIIFCCLLCVFFVKEPNTETKHDRSKSSYNFRIIPQNRPFIVLFFSL
ncbi:MAG: MFS transporter [Proteobacteria bacterium]|nr:MFS transporter [Pseudomonadota bacterium]